MSTLAERAVSFLAAGEPSSPGRAPGVSFGPGQLSALRAAGWEPCGLVAGAAVYHVGVVGWPTGNVEVGQLTGALNSGRDKALAGLRANADALGAEGVLDVRLEVHFRDEHRHLPRFVITGVAVRRVPAVTRRVHRSPEPSQGPVSGPFTAAMSPAQFGLLIAAGYEPAGVVMGTCVFHIGRQGFTQWAKTQRQNVEMTSYTTALYEARSLAMARLQEESSALGADGVIGVTTTESSHVWGDQVIEFFASGTAVRSTKDPVGARPPALVVTLADQGTGVNPAAITDALRGSTTR